MMTPSRSPRPFVATMVCLPGAQRPLAGYRLPIHELGGVERCAQVQRLELPTQRRIDEVGGVVRRAADAELRVAAGDGARRGAVCALVSIRPFAVLGGPGHVSRVMPGAELDRGIAVGRRT